MYIYTVQRYSYKIPMIRLHTIYIYMYIFNMNMVMIEQIHIYIAGRNDNSYRSIRFFIIISILCIDIYTIHILIYIPYISDVSFARSSFRQRQPSGPPVCDVVCICNRFRHDIALCLHCVCISLVS